MLQQEEVALVCARLLLGEGWVKICQACDCTSVLSVEASAVAIPVRVEPSDVNAPSFLMGHDQ